MTTQQEMARFVAEMINLCRHVDCSTGVTTHMRNGDWVEWNPFANANDDVMVLSRVLVWSNDDYTLFEEELRKLSCQIDHVRKRVSYRIGDYTQAAYNVKGNDDE